MEKKQVFLARPHPMIVEDMKHFLADAGFEPQKDASQIEKVRLGGIILSTAVSTETGTSLEETFAQVSKDYPGVPVALATLLSIAAARRSAESLRRNDPFEIIDFDQKPLPVARSGSKQLLILRKIDLTNPTVRSEAIKRIQVQFGG